ncbi:MAG: hypothetical protein KAF24_01750 [Nitrosopumilaceae archaeon]|nr:hypothetical protein [Nitrosopumilaceae archaeon]
MLTKRTIIGITFGVIISMIGLYAFISSLGTQTAEIKETVKIADYLSYQFNSPIGSDEILYIQGDLFHVDVKSLSETQINQDFKDEIKLDWLTGSDGENIISIKNIGHSELIVNGILKFSTDPILYTYHILVITAGIVIIGFSASFSIKRKKSH